MSMGSGPRKMTFSTLPRTWVIQARLYMHARNHIVGLRDY